MIPDEIGSTIEAIFSALRIAAYLMLFFVLLYLFVRQMVRLIARDTTWRRHPEPETFGDDGGRPAPADYSDEVTDEHFKRIEELVDQNQFDDAETISGPGWPFTDAEWEKCCADARDARPWDEPAPEIGSGERAGDGRPSIYREW